MWKYEGSRDPTQVHHEDLTWKEVEEKGKPSPPRVIIRKGQEKLLLMTRFIHLPR